MPLARIEESWSCRKRRARNTVSYLALPSTRHSACDVESLWDSWRLPNIPNYQRAPGKTQARISKAKPLCGKTSHAASRSQDAIGKARAMIGDARQKSQGLPVDMITPTLFFPALHRVAWPALSQSFVQALTWGIRNGCARHEICEQTGAARRSEPGGLTY